MTAKLTVSLAERVQRLEDLEQIRDLMSRYAVATSKGQNSRVVEVEQLPSIFASDATWEGPSQRVTGLENIMEGLRSATAHIEYSTHVFSNPVLTLDGDSASGTWLLSVVAKRNGNYHHGQAPEDVTYIRTPWGWRIQSVRLQGGVFFPLREDVT
ncbi:MAG: nuclear transport factor 2 family protein [Polyangiaceae bacterium]